MGAFAEDLYQGLLSLEDTHTVCVYRSTHRCCLNASPGKTYASGQKNVGDVGGKEATTTSVDTVAEYGECNCGVKLNR